MTKNELLDSLQSAAKAGTMNSAEKSAMEMITGANSGFQNLLNKEAIESKKAEAEAEAKRIEQERLDAEAELRANMKADEFLLTDMTGGRLPASGINHKLFRYPEGTWEEAEELLIPEVDPFFYWDADVLEALWLGYICDEKILATGPPGTGKTTITNQLAAWIRQPWARFNGKKGIDPSAFLGAIGANQNGTYWQDGLLPVAVSRGYLVVIDEVFKLSPGIQMALQSLYEKNGFLMLDEKPGTIADKHVHSHSFFRLIGTDNTKGTGDDLDKYGAGELQDVSSIDRFGITVDVPYLPKDVEVEMFTKRFPTVDTGDISRAVTLAGLVRTAYLSSDNSLSLTMSPRGLIVVCEIIEKGLGLAYALGLAYVNKLSDDIEVNTVKGFIKDCI